jgi:glutaminyl-peptide cyclotransferase
MVSRRVAWGLIVIAGAASVSLVAGTVRQARAPKPADVPVHGYRVVNAYPHDANAYTQGLIWRDGFLYESTGQHGRSSIRKVKLETGEVVQRRDVDRVHFAEGLVDWQGELVQLTWQSEVAFVYDLITFTPRRTFKYSGEGWGLTRDGKGFILSDGSDQLRFLDPATFAETRRVSVKAGNVPVDQLNELEFIRGEIWANVWHSNRIARIAPQTGRVTSWVDLSGLMSSGYRLDAEAVLNGIAFDPATGRLFVTGKLWPRLFEIQVVPR